MGSARAPITIEARTPLASVPECNAWLFTTRRLED
jgi:hypothetical protein